MYFSFYCYKTLKCFGGPQALRLLCAMAGRWRWAGQRAEVAALGPHLFPWSFRPPVLEDRIRFSLGPWEETKEGLTHGFWVRSGCQEPQPAAVHLTGQGSNLAPWEKTASTWRRREL